MRGLFFFFFFLFFLFNFNIICIPWAEVKFLYNPIKITCKNVPQHQLDMADTDWVPDIAAAAHEVEQSATVHAASVAEPARVLSAQELEAQQQADIAAAAAAEATRLAQQLIERAATDAENIAKEHDHEQLTSTSIASLPTSFPLSPLLAIQTAAKSSSFNIPNQPKATLKVFDTPELFSEIITCISNGADGMKDLQIFSLTSKHAYQAVLHEARSQEFRRGCKVLRSGMRFAAPKPTPGSRMWMQSGLALTAAESTHGFKKSILRALSLPDISARRAGLVLLLPGRQSNVIDYLLQQRERLLDPVDEARSLFMELKAIASLPSGNLRMVRSFKVDMRKYKEPVDHLNDQFQGGLSISDLLSDLFTYMASHNLCELHVLGMSPQTMGAIMPDPLPAAMITRIKSIVVCASTTMYIGQFAAVEKIKILRMQPGEMQPPLRDRFPQANVRYDNVTWFHHTTSYWSPTMACNLKRAMPQLRHLGMGGKTHNTTSSHEIIEELQVHTVMGTLTDTLRSIEFPRTWNDYLDLILDEDGKCKHLFVAVMAWSTMSLFPAVETMSYCGRELRLDSTSMEAYDGDCIVQPTGVHVSGGEVQVISAQQEQQWKDFMSSRKYFVPKPTVPGQWD